LHVFYEQYLGYAHGCAWHSSSLFARAAILIARTTMLVARAGSSDPAHKARLAPTRQGLATLPEQLE
jgi:hypothetical protein